MTLQIKAPQFPESVAEGTLVAIHVQQGDTVAQGTLIAEVETDKVVLEVMAEASGTISKLLKAEGDTVEGNEVIGELEEGDAPAIEPAAQVSEPTPEVESPSVSKEPIASPAAKRIAQDFCKKDYHH